MGLPARAEAPSVSVIIPVWNGEQYLEEAIESVRAQAVAVSELIIVDDGSSDGTAAIARAVQGATCLYQPHAGQAAARNLGVARATGRFLAFLDADDRWTPDKLARQLEQFAQRPTLDAVFGHAIQFRMQSDDGAAIPVGPPAPAHLPGAMLIRHEAFDRVGGYSAEWQVGEVVDWYARAVDCHLSMVTLQDIVLERRLHGDNLGVTAKHPAGDYLKIMRRLLARRRSGHPNRSD